MFTFKISNFEQAISYVVRRYGDGVVPVFPVPLELNPRRTIWNSSYSKQRSHLSVASQAKLLPSLHLYTDVWRQYLISA